MVEFSPANAYSHNKNENEKLNYEKVLNFTPSQMRIEHKTNFSMNYCYYHYIKAHISNARATIR